MEDREPTAWEETTGQIVPFRRSSDGLTERLTDTRPSGDDPRTRGRFAIAIGRCLALVAPVGMSEDAREVWIDAAFTALRHLPISVIENGAREAIKTADHPSKIVPAIIAATKDDMAWRRRMSPRPQPEALPAPGRHQCTASEASEILQRYGLRAKVNEAADPSAPTELKGGKGGRGRMPTREDYIRMGVDPAALDQPADAA